MAEAYKIEKIHPISQHSPFRRHHPALAPKGFHYRKYKFIGGHG